MDLSKILIKYYINNEWICESTYESLEWKDTTIPKPSKEHFEKLWNDLLKDEMREDRNKLLKESDFRVLIDYNNNNKDQWIQYRQELRDFPTIWVHGMPFPTPPQ
jgi:hypothetical protein